MPTANTGLTGIPIETLPPWVAPQAGARNTFRNPVVRAEEAAAALQADRPDRSRLQGAARLGQATAPRPPAGLREPGTTRSPSKLSTAGAKKKTNFWNYLNARRRDVSQHPPGVHLPRGHRAGRRLGQPAGLTRSTPRPTTSTGNPRPSSMGDNTYKLTFTPPETAHQGRPVDRRLPADRTTTAAGNPRGFWSIHVYQTDSLEAAAPFLTQPSVAEHGVLDGEPGRDRRRRGDGHAHGAAAATGRLGAAARQHADPLRADRGAVRPHSRTRRTTSSRTRPRPTTGRRTRSRCRRSGSRTSARTSRSERRRGRGADPGRERQRPATLVDLANPGGAVNLQWGPIQPVSQLGSQQLTSNSLVRNPDRSVTFWIGPTLPPGAPASNWFQRRPRRTTRASTDPDARLPTGSSPRSDRCSGSTTRRPVTSRPRSCRRRAES